MARKSKTLGIHPKDQVLEIMEGFGLSKVKPVFDESAKDVVAQSLSKRNIDTPPEDVVDDLSRTYFIDYSSNYDPKTLSAKISGMSGVVYAEPHYVYYTEEIPNDTLYGMTGQNYFEYQNFPEAWEISKSSTDVVIAIIDSGVFYNHPDLVNKLHRIEPQPSPASQALEAVENDSIGWDFWESGDIYAGEDPVQTNDPIARWSVHGTHVAGIAAAETNNGIGIAGTGYNVSFMPVKAGGTQQYPRQIPYGMNGIIYAALNEADIINCSFGGEGYSKFGQDAVTFATEQGSLVVASAGNTGSDVPFFPASYHGALAVGSADLPSNSQTDQKSDYSTYGYDVDVFSTGRTVRSTGFEYDANEGIWTTTPDSLGYIFSTGTSMSAPIVSGLAALIKSQHPDWSPQRIAYQIRNTARPMDANHSSQFQYKLGRGVIDALAALTETMPGLEIMAIEFRNNDGEMLNVGEAGLAEITLINHGEPANPSVSISSLTDYVTILNGTLDLGNMATNETRVIELGITIDEGYDLEHTPVFNITFTDQNANYEDFSIQEYDDLLYQIISTDSLVMSFSNDGTIGFLNPFEQDGGIGFIPGGGENQLFEGGLIIQAEIEDTIYVPNQVRFTDEISRHFSPVQNIGLRSPELADVEAFAEFNSSNHPVASDLKVEMETYAFEGELINQMVFVRYAVTNTSSKIYNNVYVGLFNDWDIGTVDGNNVGYSEPDSLIFAFDGENEEEPFVAVAHMGVISSALAIDNTSVMTLEQAETRQDSLNFGIYYENGVGGMDGFTIEEKKLALTAGIEKTLLGSTDISIVTATGPFNLQEGGAVTVGFIYAYGEDLDELRRVVQAGRERELFSVTLTGTYHEGENPSIIETTRLYQNFPNPFSTDTQVQYDLAEPGGYVQLDVYNVLGQRVTTLVDDIQTDGRRVISYSPQGLASGVYLIVLRVDGEVYSRKMSLVK